MVNFQTKEDAVDFVKKGLSDNTFYTTKHSSNAVDASNPASAFMSTFDPHYEDPAKMIDFLDRGDYGVSACHDNRYNSDVVLFYPQGTSLSATTKTGSSYNSGSTSPDFENDCILAVSGFQQGIHGYPVSLSAIQNEIGTRYTITELK